VSTDSDALPGAFPRAFEKLPEPTLELVQKYFEERGLSGDKNPCPSCGQHNTWALLYEPGIVGIVQYSLSRSGLVGERTLRLFTLSCGHCGYVRQYLYNAFQAWLAARTAAESKAPEGGA